MKIKNTSKPSVLFVSNTYPSKEVPYSGIFILNQYLYLKNTCNTDINIFYIIRSLTGPIGSSLKYLLAFIRFLPYFFKRYNIIHVHFLSPLLFCGFFYKKLHPSSQIMLTVRGGDINEIRDGSISQKVYTYLIRYTDVVFSVGSTLAKQTYVKVNRNVDFVLPSGIDSKEFYLDNSFERIYDFMFAGTFLLVKGIDVLLDGIIKLNRTDITYCFAGGGKYLPQIEALKNRYSISIFIEQNHEQLRKLYNSSKFLVLPSRSEGFPNASMEAMFCGTPVIGSNINQFKEQIDDGVNGLLMNEYSSLELVNQFKRALVINKTSWANMSKAAIEKSKVFSLENVCNQLINIYQNNI